MKLKKININERMEHYNVAGLTIGLINNGQLSMTECFGVLEEGTQNEVNSNSLFSACSMSKFLTSVLVMKLTEQGIFDLDEDVNKRLTSWKVPDNDLTKHEKVTLRKLLSHQSGIIDPEDSFIELNSNEDIPFMVELLEGRTPYCTDSIEVKYEPGSDFQYSDAGFCIIQQLIEDVTGKPFKELMHELIFGPLKMENSTLETEILEAKSGGFSCGHKSDGKIVDVRYPIYPYPAASGLWTNPTDLATLVIELMDALKGESKIGLSTSKAKEIINPQGCKEWSGLGLFLDDSEQNIEVSSLGWGVGFQCMMVAYPYLGKGAVIMINTDLGTHQLKGIIGEIYQSLIY